MGTLADYKKNRLKRKELPGGLTVKLQSADLEQVALSGAIPLELVERVAARGDKIGEGKVSIKVNDLLDTDGVATFWELLNNIVSSCVVEVLVSVEEADDDEIVETYAAVEDVNFDPVVALDFADKLVVFEEAMSATRDLERFRSGSHNNDADTHSGESIRPAPKHVSRRK